MWKVLSSAEERTQNHLPEEFPPSPSSGGGKKGTGLGGEKRVPCSTMPVFESKPLHEFRGHEADVLDLSWSKVCPFFFFWFCFFEDSE